MASFKDTDFLKVVDLIHGFAKSQWLFSAVELGIFEHLNKKGEPCTHEEVSLALELDDKATERLMNACTSIDLLQKNENGKYNLTQLSQLLLKDHFPTLHNNAKCNKEHCYKIAEYFKEAVQTGKPQSQLSGTKGDEQYKLDAGYYNNQESTRNFVAAMDDLSACYAPELVKLFDLSQFNKACDLGGSSGVYSSALANEYPNMEVTVFDLPHVIDVTPEFVSPQILPRLKLQAGNFFEDPLPAADLYMLNHVLEDWAQEKIDKLLAKVYASLPEGGALLLVAYCFEDNGVGQSFTHVVDINQLASVEGGCRRAKEWRIILQHHGFQQIQTKDSKTYFGDVIIAYKPSN